MSEEQTPEMREANAKYAYIVTKGKRMDSRGRPKHCGTVKTIFDDGGKDVTVFCIMAIRREHGKIVTAEPLALILNDALKMRLRPAHMSREEYEKAKAESEKKPQEVVTDEK